MADCIDQACDAAKAVQAAAGQIGDVGQAAKGYQVVRADAVHGDAADDHQVAALIGKAVAERCRRVELVATKQAALPEFPHALRCARHVRVVRGNPTGAQQVADRALEGGSVETVVARDADVEGGVGRLVVAAAVGHGVLRFSAVGLVIIHAVAGRSSRLVAAGGGFTTLSPLLVISLDAASHTGL